MSATHAVLFDLGNVVLYVSKEREIANFASLCGVADAQKCLEFVRGRTAVRYEKGQITTDKLREQCSKLAGRDIPREGFVDAISDIFAQNKTMLPVLQALQKTGVRLVLASNTCEAHISFILRHFDVLNYFDELVLSYKIGFRKPEHDFFVRAIRAAGCSAQECFYTDDTAAFIAAARATGIDAEQYTNTPHLLKQLKHRNLLNNAVETL